MRDSKRDRSGTKTQPGNAGVSPGALLFSVIAVLLVTTLLFAVGARIYSHKKVESAVLPGQEVTLPATEVSSETGSEQTGEEAPSAAETTGLAGKTPPVSEIESAAAPSETVGAETGLSEAFGRPEAASEAPERGYVLNTHTMRFHLPDCPSVAKIKSGNRRDVTEARDRLIAQGYVPCGQCEP